MGNEKVQSLSSHNNVGGYNADRLCPLFHIIKIIIMDSIKSDNANENYVEVQNMRIYL